MLFHFELFIGGFFLWLGLYVLTRGLPLEVGELAWRDLLRTTAMSAGLGLTLVSLFFFGGAMRVAAPDPASYLFWLRGGWWTVPLAIALWFRAVARLPQPTIMKLSGFARWSPRVVLVYAVVLTLWGSFSESIFRYGEIAPSLAGIEPFFVPLAAGQWLFYSGFLGVVLWTAVYLLWQRYRSSQPQSHEQREFRWLVAGGTIVALGASLSIAGYASGWLPEQVGHGVLAVGLTLVGRGIAHYDAFLQQKQVAHDFRRSLGRTVLNVAIFLLILYGAHGLMGIILPPFTVLLTVVLLLGTAAARPWFLLLVNRLLLPNWESRFLFQFDQVRQAILLAPDQQEALAMAQQALIALTQAAQVAQLRELIADEVQAIFRHKQFAKDEVMGQSRLLSLKLLQRPLITFAQQNKLPLTALSEAEKARVLRHFFEEYLHNHFCPAPGVQPPNPASDQWVAYLLLVKGYVEGKTRQEIIREVERACGVELASGARTGGRLYAHYLENGRLRLADMLWQDELAENQKH
ncbi:MAG: hypothetical protein R3C62_00505 [Chloroflexota bacterium]